jgi:two-component system chemotaxis response regulator CheB
MIRCLIVDDSPTFRLVLKEILAADARFQVVGEAADGREAIELARALHPDVMTLDVHMPGLSGYEVIREVMASPKPVPILVISAAADTAADQVTFQALSLGAAEVMGKPRASDPARMAREAEALRTTIRVVAGITPITRFTSSSSSLPELEDRPPPQCVGIAASTGGPAALEQVLKKLPADFPAPILVVQHIAEGFTAGFASWLGSCTPLRVKLAEHGELLSAGTVYIAPDNQHLLTSLGRVRLSADSPRVRGFRPAATVLFTAMARDYGASGLGIVLTGMGDDGALGLKLMRDRGGHVLAQDEASSVVWGMPRSAVEAGAVNRSLPLDQLAPALMRLSKAGARRKPKLLLVDDSETILLTQKALLMDRFELFLARNGKEAVEACRSLELNAVLMDYSMPVLDGEGALKQLRAHPGTAHLPVVIITGETDPAVWRRCEAAGALFVLHKPINQNELNSAIARALRAH